MLLGDLFHEVLYRPLFNALIAAYVFFPVRDFGIAIALLTVVVRVLLHPLTARQYRSQRALQALQPQVDAIRKATRDQQEQTRKIMALYKEAKVHPASGCLPLLVQFPVLIALYQVFIAGLRPESLAALYASVPNPGTVNPITVGMLDLAKPNVLLALLAGVFQYVQSRYFLLPTPTAPAGGGGGHDFSTAMNLQARYVMPVITVVISLGFPAGLALYWATTTLLGILEQAFLKRRHGRTTALPLPRG